MKKLLFLVFLLSSNTNTTLISLTELLQGTTSNPIQFVQNFINQSTKPVILKFFANWCGACQRIKPIVEKIDSQFKDQITIINVNINDYHLLAKRYQVRKIPALIYFKNGKEYTRTNYINPKAIVTTIQKILS